MGLQTIEKPTRARALDASGNNNHGQIYSGRALEFDGVSDGLICGAADRSMRIDEGSWTFTCWFKADDATNEGCLICMGHNDTDGEHRLGLGVEGEVVVWNKYDGSFAPFNSSTIEDNTWYRAVGVIVDGTQSLYVNGVAQTDTGDTQTYLAGGEELAIGMTDSVASESNKKYFAGKICDVQVWNAAFDADDALYDYNNPEQLALNRGGTSLTNSNLKAWYPMNDGHRGQQSYILDASNTGLGDEMISNGDFSDGTTGWTKAVTASATQELVDGKLKMYSGTAGDNSNNMSETNVITAGKDGVMYRLKVDMSNLIGCTSGTIRLDGNHDADHIIRFYDGSNTVYFVAYRNFTDIQFFASSFDDTYTIDNVSLKPVNDKNHATTVFYGDMTDLFADVADSSNYGNLYNTANTEFDFTKESTAFSGGDTYDVVANSAFANANVTSLISTDDSVTGLEITNTATSKGTMRAALTAVVGRTYELNITHYDTSDSSFVDGDVRILIGNSGPGSADYVNATNEDGTYTVTFTATSTTLNLAIGNDSGTDTHKVRIKTISLKEVGLATGWTDADQQLDIPQTALQSYNQLAWFDGVADYVSIADSAGFTFATGGTNDLAFSISAWIYMNDATSFPIVCKNSSGQKEWAFETKTDAKLYFTLRDNSDGDRQARLYDTALTSYEGQWIHVVGTYGGDESDAEADINIYINGEVVDDTNDSDGYDYMRDTTGVVAIGANLDQNQYANGAITEVSIWAAALTQAEINELYNDGKALDATIHSKAISASTNLKGYFRNNGLATWTDLSDDYSNNGTVTASETMLITAGADGSRDSQGFLMNRQRATNSLNLEDDMADGIANTGSYMAALQSPFTADTDYNAMTLTLWFKTPNNTIRDSLFSIIYDNSTHFTVDTLGTGKFVWTYEGSTAVTDARYKTDADLYSSDKWTFVAFALDHDIGADANRVKCYVGDEDTAVSLRTADTTHATTTTSPSKDNSMQVGISYVNTNNFTGQVDDVCVYTKTLTLAEITRNYNAGKRSHR